MPHDEMPQSVEDVLDDTATFEPAALAAVRALARAKPWRGTDAERLAKLNACAAALAQAYAFEPWTIQLGPAPHADAEARVLMLPDLSIVTFLHAMAAIRGLSTFATFRWSINIFRKCFPRSFARCRFDGPYLRRNDAPAV